MNLYYLRRRDEPSENEFRWAIVVAPDDDFARCIHPDPDIQFSVYENCWVQKAFDHQFPCEGNEGWVTPFDLDCDLIGEAEEDIPLGVLVSSAT